ncbi:uncharacterized protein LOC120265301 [Dioscorea cayenensis subsp. rotundata]|uniref:Uncharacterized protein LOC120265301 n=1 Tax=Dioscorea cayennensis subsp. rotundata TaxID=55577 RepID=A0AB40BNS0_DIOCR|nr:uncharacterized protein LOC120265301 [Dioscorea cayenensis subsp. rotundata]
MSIFRLPRWVVKGIDRIRRDFLWSGPDIDHPGCRLVCWKNLCRPRDHGGWGILDLDCFNKALLGKWWWKFMMDSSWRGAMVIQFNYGLSRSNLWPYQTGRISFFWKGVLSCLPALRSCFSHKILTSKDTLFWHDGWINGVAPRNLWPIEYGASIHPTGTVHELRHLLVVPPFSDNEVVRLTCTDVQTSDNHLKDIKSWRLNGNGTFTVKSFYNLLIDGGLRCSISRFFWRNWCPKKISLFNWLAWQNKILTLENLARRRCNRLPTDTCVMCNAATETVDHLFIHYSFANKVWDYFISILRLPQLPLSLRDLWGRWRNNLHSERRGFGDLVAKAIIWNIWIARNDCIFNANVMHSLCLIMKIDRMLVSWCFSLADGPKVKLEEDCNTVRRSLEFLAPRVKSFEEIRSSVETLDPGSG